jgi:peptidyl-prolyl cis-trans isomerase A (cyclophilin A)
MLRRLAGLAIAGALCVTVGYAALASAQSARPSAAGATPSLLHPKTLNATAPATYWAVFHTTREAFTVKVTRSLAPIGADRFYNLVKNRFYNGVWFFRVIPGFVAQFGIHPKPAVAKAWQRAKIGDDPVKRSNTRGTIAFATTGRNTRTTQVFINLRNNTTLDTQGYAPFGKVVAGMHVVEKLYSGYGDQPSQYKQAMVTQGSAFLRKNYPKLDRILTARVAA